jgi:hypothetical protein
MFPEFRIPETEKGTHSKWQLLLVCYDWNGNYKLPFAENRNGKRKSIFLGSQPINGNRQLL